MSYDGIPSSFGRVPEPEPEPDPAMMPGVALVTVVPVLDEDKLAVLTERLRAAVCEAFLAGLRDAMDSELMTMT